jgi:hypothetical protein
MVVCLYAIRYVLMVVCLILVEIVLLYVICCNVM